MGIDTAIESYYHASHPSERSGMRGDDRRDDHLFSYVSLEQRVPADHPLRTMRQLTDAALARLSTRFEAMYATVGRPSIPPEQLLRALVLQALYSIRSERLLMEQLDYNLLFRWFVGLRMDDAVWVPTVFTKNRERLLDADIAHTFFHEVVAEARARRLLSDEHFTVDGTLLEAWASHKSFRPKDGPGGGPGGGNPTVNFHGQARRNATHASTTDPDARLYRKAGGREAHLAYLGHALMDHRHGLLVDTELTLATGTGERDAAVTMAHRRGRSRITIAGDKAFDTRAVVAAFRACGVTPHVAQYRSRGHRQSAIDRRTTRHRGYRISQRKRKLVEQAFGWMKTVGQLRQLRHRGRDRVGWVWTFTAAVYNLVRIRTLTVGTA
jgi:transposase